MQRTPAQNKQLYALLAQLAIDGDTKKDLVYQYTSGRSYASSDMSLHECQALITHLRSLLGQHPTTAAPPAAHRSEAMDRMRKRLIAKFREMQYETPEGKADIARINASLLKYWKKDINHLTATELHHIIAVIEQKWLPNFYKRQSHADSKD